ncbi:sensor domain-containing protein [Mycolicibacterium sp. 22603]|uniref:sensor domain-containing protein n=1 Tax=Mycolicibacterium sp. 22603 TaxID=3453950 RepID=UPI003F87CDE7
MSQEGFGHNPFDAPVDQPAGPASAGVPPPVVVRPISAEVNTLATLSVIFAFVFAPAGAILGHLGLAQVGRTGQRGRERALIGITLSYLVILAMVVGLVVWAAGGNDASTPTAAPPASTSNPSGSPSAPSSTAPPAPVVDAAKLPEILVPLLDLRTLMGDPGLTPYATSDKVEMPSNNGEPIGTFDDDSCFPSFVAGTPGAYEGTEWRSFYGSDSVNSQIGFQVGQAVARFDDNQAARRALDAYLAKWRGCVGKTMKWTLPNGFVTELTFGEVKDMGNGIWTQSNSMSPMVIPISYERVLAVKENVLVDNTISGPNAGDRPMKLVRAMLDRITP